MRFNGQGQIGTEARTSGWLAKWHIWNEISGANKRETQKRG
jgi:hypothetical protein